MFWCVLVMQHDPVLNGHQLSRTQNRTPKILICGTRRTEFRNLTESRTWNILWQNIREIERGRTGTGGRCMKSQTLGHWLGPARKHVSAKLWYRMTNRCSKLNFVEIEKFVKCQPFVERSSESMTVWVELNFPRCPLLKSMFPSHCDLISLYSLAGFWLF